MHRVSVVALLPEVQVGSAELFGLAEKEISAGFEIEVQSLHQRGALGAGKLRQDVHAEDAVEAANINRLGQIHRVERDQAAKARLHQQVRATGRSVGGTAVVGTAVGGVCNCSFIRAICIAVRTSNF